MRELVEMVGRKRIIAVVVVLEYIFFESAIHYRLNSRKISYFQAYRILLTLTTYNIKWFSNILFFHSFPTVKSITIIQIYLSTNYFLHIFCLKLFNFVPFFSKIINLNKISKIFLNFLMFFKLFHKNKENYFKK